LSSDTLIGIVVLILSVVRIVAYNWLLFFTEWSLMVLKITASIAVTSVLAISQYLPKPLEEKFVEELKEEIVKVMFS